MSMEGGQVGKYCEFKRIQSVNISRFVGVKFQLTIQFLLTLIIT